MDYLKKVFLNRRRAMCITFVQFNMRKKLQKQQGGERSSEND